MRGVVCRDEDLSKPIVMPRLDRGIHAIASEAHRRRVVLRRKRDGLRVVC
tara:strand:- start:950 stop:1099 length:150 start_codon:yes stop_codon:yes gene_type:complete